MLKKTLLFLTILTTFSCSYLPEPLTKNTELIIKKNADYITLTTSNTDKTKAGIIFYPGGLIDPNAYVSSFEKLVVEELD